MELDLLNRISGLDLYGYYEPSKGVVVAHFFGRDNLKPNIIAFLGRDMSWDIREIVKEKSTLLPAKEIVVIEHQPICNQPKDSTFDKLVRVGLESMAKQQYGEDAVFEECDVMFRVLKEGYSD